MNYGLIKELSITLITPMIAFFGTLIALLQWKTAEVKRNNELFKLRHEKLYMPVKEAINDLIGGVLVPEDIDEANSLFIANEFWKKTRYYHFLIKKSDYEKLCQLLFKFSEKYQKDYIKQAVLKTSYDIYWHKKSVELQDEVENILLPYLGTEKSFDIKQCTKKFRNLIGNFALFLSKYFPTFLYIFSRLYWSVFFTLNTISKKIIKLKNLLSKRIRFCVLLRLYRYKIKTLPSYTLIRTAFK